MTSNDHLVWLEAHYALGRLEIERGEVLDWRGRSEFLHQYIAAHTHELAQKKDEE